MRIHVPRNPYIRNSTGSWKPFRERPVATVAFGKDAPPDAPASGVIRIPRGATCRYGLLQPSTGSRKDLVATAFGGGSGEVEFLS